jgi:hypothetical protein
LRREFRWLLASVAAANLWATEPQSEKKEEKKPHVLEEGVIPGSIKLPGSDLSLKIGGYAKVDFIQDFDPIGNAYQFKTDTIPVPAASGNGQGGQTTIHARETRFNFDVQGKTPKGKVRAFFEGDFYGDGNSFRIRHAYGEFGNLLGGQTWTTFMDISARPRSLDYEGPDAEVFVRQAMLRWTQPLSKHWKFAVAVEQSGSQFAVPSSLTGSARNNAPDVPAFLRYEHGRGHFQVASILRQIRFDGVGASPDVSTTGWGVNSTFRVNTVGKSGVMGSFAFGNGLGRYIESMNAQNVDAVFRGNELKALPARAAVVGYEQHWNAHWQSNIAYSYASTSSDATQPATTIRMTRDVRGNLIWSPYKMVDIGGELLYGTRENRDGARGTALRLQFSMILYFN